MDKKTINSSKANQPFFSGLICIGIASILSLACTALLANSSGLGFPIAASSTLGYIYGGWGNASLPEYSLGYVYVPALLCIVITSMLAAPIGAKVVSKLEAPRLKRIFGFTLLLVALFMLNESRKAFGITF